VSDLSEYGVSMPDSDGEETSEPDIPAPDPDQDAGSACEDCEGVSSLVTERRPHAVPLCPSCYLAREGL
jgi:hypothetical protein